MTFIGRREPLELVHIESCDTNLNDVRDAVAKGGRVDSGGASHYINPSQIVRISVEPGNQLLNKKKARRQIAPRRA